MHTTTALSKARRNIDALRIDVSILRGEIKSLYLLARAEGTAQDVADLRNALAHMDATLRAIDSPTLFHPTLF